MEAQVKKGLSVEKLLKPRYIIENEWFDCPYPVGTILVPINHSNGFGPEYWEPGMYAFTDDSLDKYRYLVRKMEWTEERKLSDLPKYVKDDRGVYKVKEWHPDLGPKCTVFINPKVHSGYIDQCKECPLYSDMVPATREEYLSYINNK